MRLLSRMPIRDMETAGQHKQAETFIEEKRCYMAGADNGEKINLEQLFPSVYVIELGNRIYFRKWSKRRICVTALFQQAKGFQTDKEAEHFAGRHFWYAGMNPCICQIRWVLAAWEEPDGTRYWDGKGYTPVLQNAVSFLKFHEADQYQKSHRLQEETYIDAAAYRVKQVFQAA